MKRREIVRKNARWADRNRNRNRSANRSVFIAHNFSAIEDKVDAFSLIRKLAAHAGNNAADEAKAAGLSRVYIRNNKELVKISSAGDEVILSPRIRQSSFYVKYTPFTVLHAVKR